jgi:hypothetical protein
MFSLLSVHIHHIADPPTQPANRDREGPHGLPPPTPPDRRGTDSGGAADCVRVSHHPHRSIRFRDASREFIPEAEPCPPPRRRPSRRSIPGPDSCPPFRPSAHPRDGLAYLFPHLSALGCLTSVACAGPPRPSADVCEVVRGDGSALSPVQDTPQISRGQLSDRRCISARLIKHSHLWMEDFVVACPLVPTVPHLLSGSCPSPRTFAPRGLQTPPRADALARPVSFGSTHTWTGDVHPHA